MLCIVLLLTWATCMSCMCMCRSRTQPICGEHDVAKKKTHVAVKVHAKRKSKEVADKLPHLPMVPHDSPAMGTRSKKMNPASPAMSTRSKRRLSLWFSLDPFPYHGSFWKLLSCLCNLYVNLGFCTCYMWPSCVVFDMMWTWTIICELYVNLNVCRGLNMWTVCVYVNLDQVSMNF